MNPVTKKGGVKGFTLIEILVVIGIIAVLAAVVIIAINPARQFAQARNSQRQSNVTTILNAIGQNVADNRGTFECTGEDDEIDGTADVIGSTGVDLESCLVPTYIPQMVFDPEVEPDDADENTGYTISIDGNGRYEICAPNGLEPALDESEAICVTR